MILMIQVICLIFLFCIHLLIVIAIQPNPHAFLRLNILSFQINNHQPIDLIRVQTQVELKEINRSTRDNTESRKTTNIVGAFLFLFDFRTGTS